MNKRVHFRARPMGVKPWFCHLLAVYSWASYLISLCPSFLIFHGDDNSVYLISFKDENELISRKWLKH